MRIFKNSRTPNTQSQGRNNLAGRLAGLLLRVQLKWSVWMQRQSERLNRTGKIILMVTCCAGAGGYSTYLILKGAPVTSGMARPANIRTPVLPEQPKAPALTADDTMQLSRLHRYMDSLSRNHKGRKLYDSLMRARPGLIDSLHSLQQQFRQ